MVFLKNFFMTDQSINTPKNDVYITSSHLFINISFIKFVYMQTIFHTHLVFVGGCIHYLYAYTNL